MFCEPCQSAMVTRLSHSLVQAKLPHKRKLVNVPVFKVTSTCVECGTMEDVGHIV